jgi:hypothetical protein
MRLTPIRLRRRRAPLRPPRVRHRPPSVPAPRLPRRARGDRRRAPRDAARDRGDRGPQRRHDGAARVQRPVAPLRAHVLQGEQGHPRPARVLGPAARARHGLQRYDRGRPGELLLHDDVRPLRRRDGLHARRHHLAALRQGRARPRARRRDRRDGPRRVGPAVSPVARRGAEGLLEVPVAEERARRAQDRPLDDAREDADDPDAVLRPEQLALAGRRATSTPTTSSSAPTSSTRAG